MSLKNRDFLKIADISPEEIEFLVKLAGQLKYLRRAGQEPQFLKGKNIALITDAGTPAISDPGEVLVQMCHKNGVPVTSLPGAWLTGLSAKIL